MAPIEKSDSKSPQLSVVIASAQSEKELERSLEALMRQAFLPNVEVVVADCCHEGVINAVKLRFPTVKFQKLPRTTTLPYLWAAGINSSEGQLIAFTDTSCIVEDNWISAILKAHDSDNPVIGGAVEVRGCQGWTDWAAYFCEYGQFMSPLKPGMAGELPGNNLSFKRGMLEKGVEFVQDGFWKTYWCRRLQEDGIQLVLDPSIIVTCQKPYRLIPFLVRRFHHGRCFAGMRVKKAPLLLRSYFLAGAPILPLIFLARLIKSISSKGRYYMEFALSFHVSLLAILSWSVGEFWGYLTGPGNSCAHIY